MTGKPLELVLRRECLQLVESDDFWHEIAGIEDLGDDQEVVDRDKEVQETVPEPFHWYIKGKLQLERHWNILLYRITVNSESSKSLRADF
jgi:hypothetical protein